MGRDTMHGFVDECVQYYSRSRVWMSCVVVISLIMAIQAVSGRRVRTVVMWIMQAVCAYMSVYTLP